MPQYTNERKTTAWFRQLLVNRLCCEPIAELDVRFGLPTTTTLYAISLYAISLDTPRKECSVAARWLRSESFPSTRRINIPRKKQEADM